MDKLEPILILATFIGILTQQYKTAANDKRTRAASIIMATLYTVVYHLGILGALGMKPAIPFGEYLDYLGTGALAAFGPNVILAVRAKAVTPSIQITQDTPPTPPVDP